MEHSYSTNIIFFHSLNNIEYISEGNFGVIFKGSWNGSPVVIKLPKKKLGESTLTLKEFEKELNTNLRIPKHESILPILGLCPNFDINNPNFKEYCPGICIVTPFCEKGNLHDLFIEERIQLLKQPNSIPFSKRITSSQSIISFAAQVASGLTHLHKFNVIHRDIAARNVLINSKGRALLCDFGLSRLLPQNINQQTPSFYQMKDPSKEVPIRWLAPESLKTFQYTSKSDVWMFGVFLWELMTGMLQPYHETEEVINVVAGISSNTLHLTLPTSINIHPQIITLFQRCTRYEPQDRPSMKEIMDDLNKIDSDYCPYEVYQEIYPNLNNNHYNDIEDIATKNKSEELLDQSNTNDIQQNERDNKEKIKIEVEKEIEQVKLEMEKKLQEQMKIIELKYFQPQQNQEPSIKNTKRYKNGYYVGSIINGYEGQHKNGKKHGNGIYYYSNGERYEGQFYDEKKNGMGVYYFKNGDIYNGQYVKGKRHGQGVYNYNHKGDRYEGQYVDGKRHGHGLYYFSSGNRYEGQWSDDKKHGKGTYYFTSGNRYEGEYLHDNQYRGIYYYQDGRTYIVDESKNASSS